MANPAIVNNLVNVNGNKTITFVGKPGGANYYLTNLTMNGNTTIIFNNAAGPINIWFGPDGGNGNIDINGGTASVKMSTDPSKTCIIYNATNSAVNLNGNSELDAGVYAYNGAQGGQVNFNGTDNIDGEVISNTFNFNGTPDVTAVSGYFNAGN